MLLGFIGAKKYTLTLILSRAFRKHYYYLGSLEMDPVFLREKIPESRKDRREMRARSKAEKKLIKEETGVEKMATPKCYARTPLEVTQGLLILLHAFLVILM